MRAKRRIAGGIQDRRKNKKSRLLSDLLKDACREGTHAHRIQAESSPPFGARSVGSLRQKTRKQKNPTRAFPTVSVALSLHSRIPVCLPCLPLSVTSCNKKRRECEHEKQRSQCKECGGSGICEHGRQRSTCKECGGSQICEHGRRRSQCKECGGSGICEHGKRRSDCKECGGSQICEHGKRRSTCKECSGRTTKMFVTSPKHRRSHVGLRSTTRRAVYP